MIKNLLFISLFALVLFAGCAKQKQEPKLTSVSIAFQEWVGYGPFYLAQEKGFCKENGIELIFIDEPLDAARQEAFKQGMLDCEAGTIDLLVAKAALDVPVVAVMEIDQSAGADAIVASEGINKLEDLAGKKVALTRDDVGETFLSILLHKNNLSFKNLIILPKNTEEVAQTFLNGEADACVTWEPYVSLALKKPLSHILASTKDHPGIIIDTLNVRSDLAENNPELVKNIMKSWFMALHYCREHPDEAYEIISKYYNLTPTQYKEQIRGLKWENSKEQLAYEENKEWIQIFNMITEIKFKNNRISKKPEASKFLNHDLIEKLYENS
jgi:NitT/TauT family transport system substrate-binding protein